MSIKKNIYDYLLMLLIALLAFGTIGNGAQPARLLILAVCPFMFLSFIKRPSELLYYYKYEFFFFIGWLLWACAFLFKAIDLGESAKSIIYLFIHFIGVIEIFWMADRAEQPQESLQKGWILLLVVTIPLALNEFLTGEHFASSLHDDAPTMAYGAVRFARPYAAVTFGNLNSFNTVLCWALPSLLFYNLYPKRKIDQLFGYLLLFLVIVVIAANASRGAILCLGVLLIAYVYCYYRTGRNRVALTVVIAVVSVVLVYFLFDIFFVILKRFSTQGMQDAGRVENIVQGVIALADSGGLGIGIGNYGPIMSEVYGVRYAAPHNIFLEVLVCFGVVVFLIFLGMIYRLFKFAQASEHSNRVLLLFSMVALLFAGIVDSNYLMKVPTWAFLATIYIYVDKRYNKQQKIEK